MAGRWTSFVALGDSFTEGLNDLREDGTPRGWADRVAAALAARNSDFRYANLAIRGLRLDAVVDEQVPAALAMRPDLISIAAGGNDVLRNRFDLARLGARMREALQTLTASGATVVAFAGFDPPGLPLAGRVQSRAGAYNDLVRKAAADCGAILVDLWKMPALSDRRMWSSDRIHLSSLGHQVVCGTVLTAVGEQPGPPWPIRLDPLPPQSRIAARRADAAWAREHLLPWIGRRVRGRSSGDGLRPKRAELQAWSADVDGG